VTHRDLIISAATRYRPPNVYPFRDYPASGGLASYGPNLNADFARSATYIDCIQKGDKPADLPVQAPEKYELVVNLRPPRRSALKFPQRCSPVPTM
jgi:putative ABC transport system substrate-binding protein